MEHPATISSTQPPGKARVVLMLQGHPSPFWGELRDHLVAGGHRVVKVHFCLADEVFWRGRPALKYRGRFRDWETWLGALIDREGITDILYFADRLPYHAVAQEVGNPRGVRCWAIEFGYLRPDWLTMERDGMGARSRFPKERSEIEELAQGMPAPDQTQLYRHEFLTEASHEVAFNLLRAFGRPFYPFYWPDKAMWPAIEYLSWLPLLPRLKAMERAAGKIENRLISEKTPFNLVAMQLEVDYQIRASSHYANLDEFVTEVLNSFKQNAPADRRLIFKQHPLDHGLSHWFSRIRRMATQVGVADRVQVIRGGDLDRLLKASKGAVMVNSTVGLHAIRLGIPVCVTGKAVFDLTGLTHQSGLDTFWTAPEPVDMGFAETFRRALSRIQIKGSFFDPVGRRAAIDAVAARLRATN